MTSRMDTGGFWWMSAGVVLALVVLGGCGADGEERTNVATVGPIAISAEDFARSYEFGFAASKRGSEPRMAYLNRMIDEALLAAEGYRQGLDETDEVQRRIASLRDELLVEQVFERYVNDRVDVTDDEVMAAMQEDRVSFRLRYLLAPTEASAQRMRRDVQSDGFDAALDALLAADAEQLWRREDFESPYVTAHDVDPVLMAAIRDLPVGEISEPVRYRDGYILLQVEDVRREPVPPMTDVAERNRYEQVLFQRKARAEARRMIGETMGPKQVEVKGPAYAQLQRDLWSWYRQRPPAINLLDALESAEGPAADRLRALLPEVLITSTDGTWTVEDFLREYPVDRYPLSVRSEREFESDLYDAIGLLLRDREFVRMAEEERLGDRPEVKHEIDLWTNKWVQQELMRRMTDTMTVGVEEARAYFEAHPRRYQREQEEEVVSFSEVEEEVRADLKSERLRASMDSVLAELRARYEVQINRAVLDTLSLSDRAGPDAMIFKGHTGRLAFPVVDPGW